MASLCRSALFRACRPLYLTTIRHKQDKYIPEPLELATGLEKAELLAIKSGNTDPFGMNAMTRGPGTKEQPNIVPSMCASRIVGCICEEDSLSISWIWVHEGIPRRCGCGAWYKLVRVPPLEVYPLK